MDKYNLVVVGAGSGGLMVAAGAAGLGARVALVEKHRMGGDCLNTGCVPSKALIASAARIAAPSADGVGNGCAAGGAGEAGGAWPEASAAVRAAIDAIAPHDSVERFESLGVEVLLGVGHLLSPTEVEVALHEGGRLRLSTRAIVIATGSTPAVPPIPGLADSGYLTNEQIFDLADLPRRLCVLGGGAIGTELGQSFARLGSQVTLIEQEARILPRDDEDAAEVVAESLRSDGMTLLAGHRVTRVERAGEERIIFYQPVGKPGEAGTTGDSEEASITVDKILVAAGRRLNVDGLGLAEAGVEHGVGGIAVNARMQTSTPSVYACGDVVGGPLFTHTAGQQARVVIQNSLLPVKARMDLRVMPSCTFTDPELAQVGLTTAQAEAGNIPYRAIHLPFSGNDRAVCEGDTRGFLKVLTPPGKDDILGATLVGKHAGEIIHEIVLAMQARIGLGALARMVHIYPTRGEIFRRAADEARKASFTPTAQRMLAAWLRWRRR